VARALAWHDCASAHSMRRVHHPVRRECGNDSRPGRGRLAVRRRVRGRLRRGGGAGAGRCAGRCARWCGGSYACKRGAQWAGTCAGTRAATRATACSARCAARCALAYASPCTRLCARTYVDAGVAAGATGERQCAMLDRGNWGRPFDARSTAEARAMAIVRNDQSVASGSLRGHGGLPFTLADAYDDRTARQPNLSRIGSASPLEPCTARAGLSAREGQVAR
jgi:hypothetical protein